MDTRNLSSSTGREVMDTHNLSSSTARKIVGVPFWLFLAQCDNKNFFSGCFNNDVVGYNIVMNRRTLRASAAIFLISLSLALAAGADTLEPDFVLTADQTHDKFSSAIRPAIRVPAGSVIEAFTHEATGGQLNLNSTLEDFHAVDMNRVHTLTGPVYVAGAEPGDILAVELIELEPGDWGWTGTSPDFGFLAGEHSGSLFRTFKLDKANNEVEFTDGIWIPLSPFPGVMGVAPDTAEMLNTIPPRANGGNMDDPNLTAGTTVYFPVFVEGALFSIGDTHAVQGLGEVAGTALESPMRIRYRVDVIKGRSIAEPQYETETYYATTGFATTIDEAARKATRYMIEHLSETRGLSWEEAYMLCSLAGNLLIAETVDVPHMLVSMHMPKRVLRQESRDDK